MTDRQPGAPGQYKMIMDGVEHTVVLVRDDHPILEGTPYNKASVLPDDLAARICPTVIDPTPADAFNGLRKKKFPATLFAANWETKNGLYTQTVVISSVTGDENESIRCWPVYTGTKATDEQIQEEIGEVSYAKTDIGKVIFTCIYNKPAIDIPIMVEVSR